MSNQSEQEKNETLAQNGASYEPADQTEQTAVASQEIIEALQQELTDARSKVDEYLDGWQRSRAEFTNYKKRIERDQAQTYQLAAGNVISHFLLIADDLERALKNRPVKGVGASWADGIELIYRKLLNLLESEGVTIIPAEGKPFDPNIHEAVFSEENKLYKSGEVIEVIQQGYMQGDRVLRPSKVRVAR